VGFQGFIRGHRSGEAIIGVNQDIIDFSSSGDNEILPVVAGRKLQILFLVIMLGGASNIRFKSDSTSLSGLMPFAANQGLIIDGTEIDIETLLGEAFVINSSAAVQVGGWIKWRLN